MNIEKLKLFDNLLYNAWMRKTNLLGNFVTENLSPNSYGFTFSLPNNIKIDGVYPNKMQIYVTNKSQETILDIQGLVVLETRSDVVPRYDYQYYYTIHLNYDVCNLLERYRVIEFESTKGKYKSNTFYSFNTFNAFTDFNMQNIIIQREKNNKTKVVVKQYWSLISGDGSVKFKKKFKHIDLSLDEKVLEKLANDTVEWLYKYMTEISPKLFKSKVKEGINKVFNALREKIEE